MGGGALIPIIAKDISPPVLDEGTGTTEPPCLTSEGGVQHSHSPEGEMEGGRINIHNSYVYVTLYTVYSTIYGFSLFL